MGRKFLKEAVGVTFSTQVACIWNELLEEVAQVCIIMTFKFLQVHR